MQKRSGEAKVRIDRKILGTLADFGYSIRLGTFNVNGKTPSQDLAAWVRGSSKKEPTSDT